MSDSNYDNKDLTINNLMDYLPKYSDAIVKECHSVYHNYRLGTLDYSDE